MSREETFAALESQALRYADLRDVPVSATDEPLVPIPASDSLNGRQIGEDMLPITGKTIYVRQEVARRLSEASLLLTEIDAGLGLEVVFGYRALSVQQRLFEGFKTQLSGQYADDALLEAVHRLIAVPDVAGHPAGAAVDIQIVNADGPLDFGTPIWSFVPDSFTYSPYVTPEATSNRLLLRSIMMNAGFAPFDGEWWHFSYGDREWAKYYDKPSAIYEQIEFAKLYPNK